MRDLKKTLNRSWFKNWSKRLHTAKVNTIPLGEAFPVSVSAPHHMGFEITFQEGETYKSSLFHLNTADSRLFFDQVRVAQAKIDTVNPKALSVLGVIHLIAIHPETTNVVILDEGDRTPLEAIATLLNREQPHGTRWAINGDLVADTLLVYHENLEG